MLYIAFFRMQVEKDAKSSQAKTLWKLKMQYESEKRKSSASDIELSGKH